jgi:hypothetical protein
MHKNRLLATKKHNVRFSRNVDSVESVTASEGSNQTANYLFRSSIATLHGPHDRGADGIGAALQAICQ